MKISTIYILLFSFLFIVACGDKDSEEARQNLIGDWKGTAMSERGLLGGTSFFREREVRVSIMSDESAIIMEELIFSGSNSKKYSWSYQSDPETIIFESVSLPETKYIMTILKNDKNKLVWRASKDVAPLPWAVDTNLVVLDTFLIRDSSLLGGSVSFEELWELERE